MRFYTLWQDMSLSDQWFLSELKDSTSKTIDGWEFTMGVFFNYVLPLSAGPVEDGQQTPISFGGLDTPYFRRDIVDAVSGIDNKSIQRIPITINKAIALYEVLNVVRKIDAIHESSDIDRYSKDEVKADADKENKYRYIARLVLDLRRVPRGVHIFRLEKYPIKIIVSELIKQAIENVCPGHGGKFTPIVTA